MGQSVTHPCRLKQETVKNKSKKTASMIRERSLVNSSRPSVIGASSDIARNDKPPSVTPTGIANLQDYKALGSQPRA